MISCNGNHLRTPDRGEKDIARIVARFQEWLGLRLAAVLPRATRQTLARRVLDDDLQPALEAFGRRSGRGRFLDTMPFDLPAGGEIRFEHLVGLFSSSSLNHGVIAMTVRQAAYLYGLVRELAVTSAIEIGRYKGGSTLLIAAAMGGKGRFWSIDIGEKESRLHGGAAGRRLDEQIADALRRLHLGAELLVGDSRTLNVDTGEVDFVLIDGDHTYEGVRVDFERFGRRVRVGGAVVFDDAFDEEFFRSHTDTVGRLVAEIVGAGDYRLVKTVDRLAHLERVR